MCMREVLSWLMLKLKGAISSGGVLKSESEAFLPGHGGWLGLGKCSVVHTMQGILNSN